ncbi:MAG: hypothetical protein KY446_08450 [Proteobacteria bacterium]|nr:hypothetical protein [Pseudomonadota bacterium]MBW3617768.1 hypothetical protein [Pseudomonadota bacterium]
MPVSRTPADTQAHRDGDHVPADDQLQLDVRRDVLRPDLRARAEDQGRDPEEVDPIADDEDALRLASLGGSASLD